jgi:hypothetical protein
MDERIEAFLADVLALEGEDASATVKGVRGTPGHRGLSRPDYRDSLARSMGPQSKSRAAIRIVLRNQPADDRDERLADLFEGVKGQRPKTEDELHEWLVSTEGKAATLFDFTSLSSWGGRARS